jgi:hypothetical protein
MVNKTAAELREELRLAEEAEEAVMAEKRKNTPVQYLFTLTLVPEDKHWDPIFDDTCQLYLLKGEVLNKDELKAVGQSSSLLFEGGMKYVFNGATGYLVCSVGGGSIFTKDPNCFAALSEFLGEHPEGGDVTSIVEYYRNIEKAERDRATEVRRLGKRGPSK